MEEETAYEALSASTDAPAKLPKRRFVGRRAVEEQAGQTQAVNVGHEETGDRRVTPHARRKIRPLNSVPPSILEDPELNAAIALLPANYNFELHKTVHTIREAKSTRVALQFPEGLLLFATTISDIITRFCAGTETLIMGDVTYGACCIDDFTARALGCDLLVHYAHSCLIPVDVTRIKTLYVFVDIAIDVQHLIASITNNLPLTKRLALVGTIQFNATIHGIRSKLEQAGFKVDVPQIKPLSKGEVLGCTAPKLTADTDILLYIGDGRFHLESAMIQNPDVSAYRYDPYARKLSKEAYGHEELYNLRSQAVLTAKRAKTWGLILGSLGRQGNPHTLKMIEDLLDAKGHRCITLMMSEIFPDKLAVLEEVDVWVQVACPRLSIDWGYAFPKPLLSPYEALVALDIEQGAWLKGIEGRESARGTYKMNFYANDGLGRTKPREIAVT